MKQAVGYVLCLALLVWFGIAMWQLQRRWNYAWSYEAMVKKTVAEMVKPEALKSGGDSR